MDLKQLQGNQGRCIIPGLTTSQQLLVPGSAGENTSSLHLKGTTFCLWRIGILKSRQEILCWWEDGGRAASGSRRVVDCKVVGGGPSFREKKHTSQRYNFMASCQPLFTAMIQRFARLELGLFCHTKSQFHCNNFNYP